MFNSIDLTTNQWTLIGLIGAITWLIFYFRWKLTYWERQGMNGPKSVVPFMDQLFGKQEPVAVKLQNNYNQYGKVYGAYQGVTPVVVIGEPELLRNICIKDFVSWPQGFGNSGYLHEIERHLVNLYGEPWKRQRTLLSPTFSSGKIKKMFTLIKNCNLEAQKVLTSMTTTGQVADFDPKDFWGRYNLDVIAKCCFAANLDVYGDKDDTLLKRFVAIFKLDKYRFLFIQLMPKWVIRMLKFTTTEVGNLKFFQNLTFALIEQRKKEHTKANDFLQLLIDLGGKGGDDDGAGAIEGEGEENNNSKQSAKLSVDEICSSCVVFLLAGYETTSTLLTWACYRLAINQDIQEKLFDEVSKSDIYDYEVLSTLPYLDAVINETLRIDPPIILFQRHNHTDYVLPGTNVTVKKGSICTIPTYAIHHDPDNYPDPEAFNPERFIQDSPKPFTFLPFGAGPRTCIGMRFALINAKLSLATMIRNYQIVTTPKTPENVEIVARAIILTAISLQLGLKPRS